MIYFQIFCTVNYDNLPFGAQDCGFKIGSWQHDESDIDVKANNDHEPTFWNPHVSKIQNIIKELQHTD